MQYILEYKHERLDFGSASMGIRSPGFITPEPHPVYDECTMEIEARTEEEAVQKVEAFCEKPTGQIAWRGKPEEERALKNIPIRILKVVKTWQ